MEKLLDFLSNHPFSTSMSILLLCAIASALSATAMNITDKKIYQISIELTIGGEKVRVMLKSGITYEEAAKIRTTIVNNFDFIEQLAKISEKK